MGPLWQLIWAAAGLGLAILAVATLRSPGWGLVLSGGLLIAAAILLSQSELTAVSGLAPACLAGGIGAATWAAVLFRQASNAYSFTWLAFRLFFGCGAGGLVAWTVLTEGVVRFGPELILAGVGLAVLAANRESVTRARLFKRQFGDRSA